MLIEHGALACKRWILHGISKYCWASLLPNHLSISVLELLLDSMRKGRFVGTELHTIGSDPAASSCMWWDPTQMNATKQKKSRLSSFEKLTRYGAIPLPWPRFAARPPLACATPGFEKPWLGLASAERRKMRTQLPFQPSRTAAFFKEVV